MVAPDADENLEQFLTQCGLAWSAIPWERHVNLNSEWEIVYGSYSNWCRQKEGIKAQVEYSRQSAAAFMIVPFLSNLRGPIWIKIGNRHPTAAYECHGDGTLADLSSFAQTEFFIVPEDLSWTMIHTHEDFGCGGPYFVYKDWLGPSRKRKTR